MALQGFFAGGILTMGVFLTCGPLMSYGHVVCGVCVRTLCVCVCVCVWAGAALPRSIAMLKTRVAQLYGGIVTC